MKYIFKKKIFNFSFVFKNLLFLGVIVLAVWFSQTDFFIFKQREFNQKLMGTMLDLKQNLSFGALVSISLFSILYGIVHALGPGHGKMILSNFLLGDSNRYKKALEASFITTFTHVGMAIFIAFLFKYVFTSVKYFQRVSIIGNFKTVSAITIALIGFFILITPILKKIIPLNKNMLCKNSFVAGLLAGSVPCPLSMTIMFVSISYSMEYIGLVLVSSIALGIFFFLLFFSLTFVYFKENSVFKVIRSGFKLPFDFRFIQGLFYIVIGILLFQ